MKKKNEKTYPVNENKNALSGYPVYPANEDIYNKSQKVTNINPENKSKIKVQNEKAGRRNEKDFDEDKSGNDLDVPGSELDDEDEKIGSEDEENNYYSLGGDDHDD